MHVSVFNCAHVVEDCMNSMAKCKALTGLAVKWLMISRQYMLIHCNRHRWWSCLVVMRWSRST